MTPPALAATGDLAAGPAWAAARRVLVCCHDAGGAEILSDWVRTHPDKAYTLALAGPAVAVFARKVPALAPVEPATALAGVSGQDFVLTGTSWASRLELDCLARARAAGVFSASYLDHWVNYGTRFPGGEGSVFPDEIWTGDDDALALAQATFPGRVVRRQANPYFDRLRAEFATGPGPALPAGEVRVLYVCEPIAIDCPAVTMRRVDLGYTEFDALALCLDRLDALGPAGAPRRLRVRLHPSEKPGKYEPVLARYRGRVAVEVAAGTTLLDDCRWSTDVVGCGSMALYVAHLGGRRVHSSIPVPGGRCPLPLRDLRYLRDLPANFAPADPGEFAATGVGAKKTS